MGDGLEGAATFPEGSHMSLFHTGARPAPDPCFEKVNAAGDTYGNCGKDLYGTYRKCETR